MWYKNIYCGKYIFRYKNIYFKMREQLFFYFDNYYYKIESK
jgi:hypothetical protein